MSVGRFTPYRQLGSFSRRNTLSGRPGVIFFFLNQILHTGMVDIVNEI